MNKSARLIFSVAPRVPTTRFLIKLHWLPIKARIEFKICLITVYYRVKGENLRLFFFCQNSWFALYTGDTFGLIKIFSFRPT